MNSYSRDRDLTAHPRVKLAKGQKKPNRARRHRLNPGRRSRQDRAAARPAEAQARIDKIIAKVRDRLVVGL